VEVRRKRACFGMGPDQGMNDAERCLLVLVEVLIAEKK
jgi:hypothetical protein